MAPPAFAAPETITIQGKLTGSAGRPLGGVRAWRVRFFNAASAGNQLGATLSGSVNVSATGRFTIELTPPTQVLAAAGAVWYELGVDSAATPDGAVTTTDIFAQRVKVAGVMHALSALARTGEAHVIVKTTADPVQNATNLLAAYAQAKAMQPHGQGLSAINRVVVLVAPGRYDLGARPLTLDTEYVDLAGLASTRDNQFIFGTGNKLSTGLLVQTAEDVHIENLVLEYVYISPALTFDPKNPAAYFPDSDTTRTVVRNCEFRSQGSAVDMRMGVAYPGTYIDCKAPGGYGFASCIGGVASGRFLNCSANSASFGGNGGTASGTFSTCEAGQGSFGHVASGTFTNCKAGDYSFGDDGGAASGTFTNCTAGQNSFGGLASVCSGTFTNCVAGSNSFGCSGPANNAAARLYGCRMTGTEWTGFFGGRMQDCHWNSGITLGAPARIYNSTFAGMVNLNETAAGLAQSRAKSIAGDTNNCFGANAGNISDPDVE